MPAHVKSSLFGASVTIPITRGRLNLGTWQVKAGVIDVVSFDVICLEVRNQPTLIFDRITMSGDLAM